MNPKIIRNGLDWLAETRDQRDAKTQGNLLFENVMQLLHLELVARNEK